jgi:hypothetical protein
MAMRKKRSKGRTIQENMNLTIKEVIEMKRREGLRLWMYAIVIVVAVMGMSLLLSQVRAQAAVDCLTVSPTSKTDTDGDGFTDYDECRGITFAGGGTFPGKNTPGRPTVRSQYLDPDTKDLFVIVVRITPTLMPPKPTNAEDVAYWFEFVSNPVGQSTGQFGLGFAVHEITSTQAPNRTVCPATGPNACQIPTNPTPQTARQKAVRVTESPDQTADNILGYTSGCGTPTGPDLTTIYTKKIYNLLSSIGQLSQLDLYIKHTIAHEIGHTVGPLAPVSGYHYESANNNLIMDKSVYQSGNNVYIGTQFTTGDQAGIHLK